jgi:hypothetical protein
MTIQMMLEMVVSAYPQCGQTEITTILKGVVDDFCKRSRLLRQSVNVSSLFTTQLADLGDDGIAVSGFEPGFTVNVFEVMSLWDLNNLAFHEINSVQYDKVLLPKYPELAQRVWWIQRASQSSIGIVRDRLVVAQYNNTGLSGKSPLTTAVDIRLSGICSVTPSFAWTTLSSTLPIPEEFHLGIVSGILRHFALVKDKDVRMAQMYAMDYERAVVNAMKRGNSGGVSGNINVKTDYY